MSGQENLDGLLLDSLAFSVQLKIRELREAGEDARALLAARIRDEGLLLGGADGMMYGGQGARRAHAAYTAAIALLAFNPGGIRFGPLSFCAAHTRERWARNRDCPACLREEIAAKARAAS